MQQVTAYRAYGIFADYDGNAPDTSFVCLCGSEQIAKLVCEELNIAPRDYVICFVDGHESSKRWRYAPQLTENLNEIKKTFEAAMAVFED